MLLLEDGVVHDVLPDGLQRLPHDRYLAAALQEAGDEVGHDGAGLQREQVLLVLPWCLHTGDTAVGVSGGHVDAPAMPPVARPRSWWQGVPAHWRVRTPSQFG